MIPREKGFLLLSSHLGDPDRKPLTSHQLRTLAQRMKTMEKPREDRELNVHDLMALGYGQDAAERILKLLFQEDLLDYYVSRGKRYGCVPVTRVSEDYPGILRNRLGLEAPGCLWAKGDLSLFHTPAIFCPAGHQPEPVHPCSGADGVCCPGCIK